MFVIILMALSLGLISKTNGSPSYNVVAPRTIRPNTNYFVAISVDGTDGELQVGNIKLLMRLCKQVLTNNFLPL